MNKVLLVSDMTLDLLQKNLKKLDGNTRFEVMFGDLNLTLPTIDTSEYFAIVVLFDPYFNKYSREELTLIENSITNFVQNAATSNVIVNNSLNTWDSAQLFFATNHTTIERIINQVEPSSNLLILDYIGLINQLSVAEFYNFNLGHLFQMPYTKPALGLIANQINQLLLALAQAEKKVVVLDCDNTLWGGIVGEDGVDGIRCSKNADGIVYFHFQNFLQMLKSSGFILCLCSKNNAADVEEAFNNKNMPLKYSDFVVKKVNWQDKVSNLNEIARELNLGIDSFIFIDDSDFEVGSVRTALPEISTFQFNSNYKNLLEITQQMVFKKRRILQADVDKTKQYIENQERNKLQDNTASIDDYIKQLEINCQYKINDIENISRLAQLTEKTNQFNLHKVPFSSAELISKIESGCTLISLAVSDKFGDYGIVGMAIIEFAEHEAVIDNIIISCRALGRKIEFQFWDYIKQVIGANGAHLKEIRFIATAKNKPAEEFLQKIEKE